MSQPTSKYRHVLPNLGHFAGYCFNHEPYGMVVPLVDRVLITRETEDEEGEKTQKDMIVGTIIMGNEYRIADIVANPSTTKFMGYIDPIWLKAKHQQDVIQYEQTLIEHGKMWATRSAPRVVPAQFEELFQDVLGEQEEEEQAAPPPRKRKGRNG